eukprot:3722169-Alexandrium_andersonii.AAC.1
MEFGVRPVQLGGALPAVECVEFQIQWVGTVALAELEEGLALHSGVPDTFLPLEVAPVLVVLDKVEVPGHNAQG